MTFMTEKIIIKAAILCVESVRYDTTAHVAINMLRAGTSIPMVAQMTELTENAVRQMAEEHGIELLQ